MLEIERAGLEEIGRQKLLEIREALGLPAPGATDGEVSR
jgi:hypothetical protein